MSKSDQDSPEDKIKRKLTNPQTVKKDIKEAEKVDPEFKDLIEGLTELDRAKRKHKQ